MKFLQKQLAVFFTKVSVTLLMAIFTSQGYAAQELLAVAQPNLFDAGRANNLYSSPVHKAPSSNAPITPPPAEKKSMPNEADKIHFKLTKVIFSGNTVYSTDELNKIFKDSLNKDISVAKLEELVSGVTKKYREGGYVLSQAILPPQRIEHGVVKIEVVEGFISGITFEGAGILEVVLKKYGEEVEKSKPLQIKKLEYYMLLSNDLPGANVKAVLTPSKTVSAGADLNFIVTQTRGTFTALYDNYGTRYLGPNEVTIAGTLNSIMVPGDTNTARAVGTTKFKQLHFAELTHAQPMGVTGTVWSTSASYAQTKPGFTLTPFDIVGRSISVYSDWSHPVIRTRTENLYVHGTLNYQNITSTILGAPFYEDRLRSIMIGANYNLVDRFRGITIAGVSGEHGYPILGARDHYNLSRPKGQAVFTKFNGNLSRLQAIGSRYSIFAAMHGQYSHNPLLATEQFGFGGPDFGRAYDPSEIVGDQGLAGKVEFRVDTFPGYRWLNTVEYYVFYDAGSIWNNDKIDLPGKQSATSTGVGARLQFMRDISGEVFIAKPLTRPVATMAILGRNAKDPRIFFQLAFNS